MLEKYNYVGTITGPLLSLNGDINNSIKNNNGIVELLVAGSEPERGDELFRSIFDLMLDGVAICEMITKDGKNVYDYHILYVNPSFEKQTGFRAENIIGLTASKFYGNGKAPNMDLYSEVIKSGKPKSFRTYFPPAQRTFQVTAIPMGGPLFATIYENIMGVINSKDSRFEHEIFRNIFENSNQATCVTKEGKLILINSEFLRLFGYKDYTELIGKNFKEVVAPNERDCYIDYLNNDLNRLKFPVLFESQGIKKDGTLFDISSYTTNFQIENESYCIIYIADITNRNIEKQDILKSEMRLEVLLSIAQFDPKSKEEFLDYALHEALILTSSKFGHIYFYDENKEEFSLHSWSDKVMEECNIVYPKTTCKLKDTGLWGEPVRQRAPVIINEYRKPHHLKRGYPEGHAIIERFLSVPVIYNDRIQAVIGVANKDEAYDDSDARQLTLLMDSVWKYIQIKDTEIAMFEYEKRYHTLFDNMTEGFALCRMIFDDKGFPDDFEYIEVNKSFEKITKLKNVVGKKVTDVIPDIKKLNPELLEIFNRVSMTGIPEKFEIELKPLSMWLSFSAYSSNKEYFVTVFDNITDRKLAEERIIHLNENLEHEVMNRTAELSDAFMKLKDANEELQVLNENIAKESTKLVMLNEKLAVSEQKLILSNQTKDKFFSIIAHDLINPFQGLLLSTELLTRYVNMNDFEKMKGKALQIHEISKHITELLENLLTWSRAQKDSLEFNPEITEISSMVDNCIEIFQENILQKNINVIHRKDPLLTALLDKNLIKTVIRNLISNAIKFSENGSEIIITYFEVGKFIVLSVRDYGIGISSEDIQKLFKIETSNRSIGKSKEKGTGLGLILCKEFVELHGGEIWVDSALGKGCKFYCILPKEQ